MGEKSGTGHVVKMASDEKTLNQVIKEFKDRLKNLKDKENLLKDGSTGRIDGYLRQLQDKDTQIRSTPLDKLAESDLGPIKDLITKINGLLGREITEGTGEAQWYKADGTINYPPNNGAVLGTEKTISLEKGQILGRYGNVSSTSDYVTAPGASPSTLSLPPSTKSSIYTEYVVVKPIPKTVQSEVAPWGGDPGGGLQYKLPMPIEQLLKDGYIIKK